MISYLGDKKVLRISIRSKDGVNVFFVCFRLEADLRKTILRRPHKLVDEDEEMSVISSEDKSNKDVGLQLTRASFKEQSEYG